MAKLYHPTSELLNPLSTQLPRPKSLLRRRLAPIAAGSRYKATPPLTAYSKDDNLPQHPKKKDNKVPRRRPRHLIRVSTSGGRWKGPWNCEYVVTLRQLQLADLAEDEHKEAQVSVSLKVQKHAGFGFSIVGRIKTMFNRKCSCCFSTYCSKVDTTFDVWVLPSSKSSQLQLPEIGGNDPSVIYVKPGYEADLDSLVQDTIRLTTSAKETCSDSCDKPQIIWQYSDGKKDYDKRWSRLLELKDAM